jgi:hypothetical protein
MFTIFIFGRNLPVVPTMAQCGSGTFLLAQKKEYYVVMAQM